TPIYLNLNRCIDKIIETNANIAEEKSVKVFVKNALTDDDSVIFADETKLVQVLTNLLSNAIKFTAKGHITIGYFIKNGFIEFFIEDTGIGIDPEYHKMIFDRFSQAKKQSGKLYGGTGLGLSISKAFVEKMGGEIWVQSEKNRGATFYFTIPFVKTDENYKKIFNDRSIVVKPFKKESVLLLVEDENSNYLFIKEVVKVLKVELLHAWNGKEAMELYEQHPEIGMVFLDIKLPDVNGYDLVKKMKKINKNIPIIAQTAYAFSGEREKAISRGCDDYISKPMRMDNIRKMFEKYL
ncbi:MAG: ATP-binding protein, partial [Bacteroidota bacterium]|nr:ATP-binding protein [Bacteroidota bacterium]